MDKEILEFLYNNFYKTGNYTQHRSLVDVFAKLPTLWNNQNSIDELKAAIIRMRNNEWIHLDHSDFDFDLWGVIHQGETFDFINNPINALLLEEGAKKIRQEKVDDSVIKTNRNSRYIGWVALIVAALGFGVAVLQYFKKDGITLENTLRLKPDTLLIRIQSKPPDTTYRISHPLQSDSSEKK